MFQEAVKEEVQIAENAAWGNEANTPCKRLASERRHIGPRLAIMIRHLIKY